MLIFVFIICCQLAFSTNIYIIGEQHHTDCAVEVRSRALQIAKEGKIKLCMEEQVTIPENDFVHLEEPKLFGYFLALVGKRYLNGYEKWMESPFLLPDHLKIETRESKERIESNIDYLTGDKKFEQDTFSGKCKKVMEFLWPQILDIYDGVEMIEKELQLWKDIKECEAKKYYGDCLLEYLSSFRSYVQARNLYKQLPTDKPLWAIVGDNHREQIQKILIESFDIPAHNIRTYDDKKSILFVENFEKELKTY